MGRALQLIPGAVIGHFTIIAEVAPVVDSAGQRRRVARVRCICGSESERLVKQLKIAKTCGCRSGSATVTHGDCRSPEYGVWRDMKKRCENARAPNFERYGGRGIAVCSAWSASFAQFLADMGRRPSSRHSLDRIDNDGDYEPGNCRWATRTQQARNTCKTIRVTVDGESVCLAEAAIRYGLAPSAVYWRYQAGWPPERLFVPSRRRRRAA